MIRRDELDGVAFSDVTTGEPIPAVTPGDVLRLDFMEPLKLSARAVARDMGATPGRVTEIVNGKRAITAETAILVGRGFGTTPRFWMNLQTAYDLEQAERAMAHAWLRPRHRACQLPRGSPQARPQVVPRRSALRERRHAHARTCRHLPARLAPAAPPV